MIAVRSPLFAPALAGFLALAFVASQSRADELVGKVKSVDADAKKVVITEKATEKDRELSVDSKTTWTKEKKGKASKKFDLAKLKVGSEVKVTSEGALASHVLIKERVKKKNKAA
jgi:hypothetical protein